MAGVGSACLAVALLTALYAVAASVYGGRSRRREWISSGRRAMYCVAALSVTAFVLLEAARRAPREGCRGAAVEGGVAAVPWKGEP